MMMLQGDLGLRIDGFGGRLVIDSPVLPEGIGTFRSRAPSGTGSRLVHRYSGSSKGATVEVTDKRGPISVEVKN